MGIFKSTKSDLAAGPDVPVNQVAAMKQQGYSNNQIIQTLQRDGYTSTQIFDAISQAEMSMTQQPTEDYGISPQTQQLGQQLPPMQQMSPMQQSMPMGNLQSSPEELIEAIIDEKWNDLVKDINKVIEWKQKADAKLVVMGQQINDMQAQFDKLHQAIIGKIGDYDRHILDVSSQLQAMEKVFGKVLPTFIDNVNDLNVITQRMKSDAPVKTAARKKKVEEE